MDKVRIFPREFILTSTREKLLGRVIGGTESTFLGYSIRQRIVPKLDRYFQPTKETYRIWEVRWGSDSWFADTLYGVQLRVLELGGWTIGGKE